MRELRLDEIEETSGGMWAAYVGMPGLDFKDWLVHGFMKDWLVHGFMAAGIMAIGAAQGLEIEDCVTGGAIYLSYWIFIGVDPF